MNKRFLILLALIFMSPVFDSCIIDPEKRKCDDWEANVYFKDQIEDLQTKAQQYLLNPGKETCLAYKKAYEDYLEELKDWKVCYDYHGLGAAYQSQLDIAQNSINNLDCDQF